MNKEKEIEEIKEIIEKRVDTNLGQIHGTKSGFGKCAETTTTVGTKLVAQAVVEAGYGNVEKAVKEFAEELKIRFIKHYPTAYKDAIYQFTDIEIDELINEIYGEKKK